jgi:ankyrin repeat protein
VQVCAESGDDNAGAEAIRALVRLPLTAEQVLALGRQLVAASGKGDVAEVRRLAAAGADVNVGEGTAAWTPLASAADAGHMEVVHELAALGARVDGVDSEKNTPLMRATRRGHARVVDTLVALGSRVDGASNLGNTALHFASKMCHVDAVRSLVGARARLDVRNSDGKTASDVVSGRLGCAAGVVLAGRVRGWRAGMHVWRRACCDGRLVGSWCIRVCVCRGLGACRFARGPKAMRLGRRRSVRWCGRR